MRLLLSRGDLVSMAPTKAVAWPASIYDDVDVLSMDRHGRFIICRMCTESFVSMGGKTPKPVTMNACFRVRAWETHKRRTRAHRKTRNSNSSRSRMLQSSGDPTELPSEESKRPAQMLLFLQQAVTARRTEMAELNRRYAHCTDDRATGKGHVHPKERPSSFRNQLASETRSPSVCYHVNTLGGNQDVVFERQTISEISHGLKRILNPMTAAEAMDWDKAKLRDSSQLRRKVDKRQRSPCSEESSGFTNTGRSDTHALYWKRMRELYSNDNSSGPHR